MSTMAYWREPAIPVRLNKKVEEAKAKANLSSDKMHNLKKDHALKRKEYSQGVQSFNSSTQKELRKKLDFWYKEQNTVLNNLRKGQENMYKIMLRVNQEKKQLQKEAYLKEQEKLRLKLNENINVWKNRDAANSVIKMFGDTLEEANKKKARAKILETAPQTTVENNEKETTPQTTVGSNEQSEESTKKNKRKNKKASIGANEQKCESIINTHNEEHSLTSIVHATEHKSTVIDNSNSSEREVYEVPSETNETLVQQKRPQGQCDSATMEEKTPNQSRSTENCRYKSKIILEPLKMEKRGSVYLKTASLKQSRLEPVYENEDIGNVMVTTNTTEEADKQFDDSREGQSLNNAKSNTEGIAESSLSDQQTTAGHAKTLMKNDNRSTAEYSDNDNLLQQKGKSNVIDNKMVIENERMTENDANFENEYTNLQTNDSIREIVGSRASNAVTTISNGTQNASQVKQNKLRKKEWEANFKEALNKETVLKYTRDDEGDYLPELNPYKRSTFYLPSGREQYRRDKILKSVRDFDTQQRSKEALFFKDLQEVIEEDKKADVYIPPKADTPPPQKPKEVPRLSIFDLSSFGKESLKGDPNSIEGLKQCSYLREYDPEVAKLARSSSVKTSSWDIAYKKLVEDA